MDIFEKLLKNRGPIGEHSERAHGYFAFPKLEGEIGARMKFRGKEKIIWSLNNYLNLANHPQVREVDAAAAKEFGLASPMGARMMSGNTTYHEHLENELSAFAKKEATILLNYGYQGILSAIDALCNRRDIIVYDAECHACIIDGLRLHPGYRYVFGAGTGEEQGVQDQIDLYFSTFAKSMASIGAFMSGAKEVINFLRYNMRSQIFAKSLPLPIVIGNIKRLELLQTEPALKEKLWENVEKLQHGLIERGFDIGTTNSPVTPIYLKGDIPEATAMCLDLRERYNIFCSIVVYPVIPRGQIIYRLIPTAGHTNDDITITLNAFTRAKQQLDSKKYSVAEIPLV